MNSKETQLSDYQKHLAANAAWRKEWNNPTRKEEEFILLTPYSVASEFSGDYTVWK